jgi:hypothetical protein
VLVAAALATVALGSPGAALAFVPRAALLVAHRLRRNERPPRPALVGLRETIALALAVAVLRVIP